AAIGRDDIDMGSPVVDEPLAVELVLQRRDATVGPCLPLLYLRCGLTRTERELCPVRRPDWHAGTSFERGKLLRLAAVGAHHIEPSLFLAPLREKCQPRPVRRPARRSLALFARSELPGRSCGHIQHPDR